MRGPYHKEKQIPFSKLGYFKRNSLLKSEMPVEC